MLGRLPGQEHDEVLFQHGKKLPPGTEVGRGMMGSGGDLHQAALLHPGFGIVSLSYAQVGRRVNPPALPPPLRCWLSCKD